MIDKDNCKCKFIKFCCSIYYMLKNEFENFLETQYLKSLKLKGIRFQSLNI